MFDASNTWDHCNFLPPLNSFSNVFFGTYLVFSSVQFSSVAQSCPTLCDPVNHRTPDLLVHQNFQSPPKPMSIELMMPSNHLMLWGPLPLLSSIFPNIRVFSKESTVCALAGQKIGASPSASVHPMNIQDWFPLGMTDLFSLQSKGLLSVFSNTTVQKNQFFGAQPSFWPSSHTHPGEGSGKPLQDYCLENPMDGGTWYATVHGVAKSWTWLSDFTIIRLYSISFNISFSNTWTKNFQKYNLDLEKGRGTRDQIAKFHWIIGKTREFQ